MVNIYWDGWFQCNSLYAGSWQYNDQLHTETCNQQYINGDWLFTPDVLNLAENHKHISAFPIISGHLNTISSNIPYIANGDFMIQYNRGLVVKLN